MNKHFIYISVIAISLSTLLTACTKNNLQKEEEKIPYTKLAEGFIAGTKVELYSATAITVGYNQLYVALFDSISNQRIENAAVTLLPMMDMGSMKHSSPVENPSSTNAVNKLFHAAVVFTMPSGSMGTWTVSLQIELNGKSGKLVLPVTVANPSVSRLKSFVSKADNSKFFVALLQPSAPKVGVNDAEFAIYKSQSMMAFPADSSLSMFITPEMPTMGHGSPNNVNPAHTTKGHYKGKVNFTMTGLWYLHLDFYAGNAVADSTTFFEVSF